MPKRGTTAEYRKKAYAYAAQANWKKALEYYDKAIKAYPKVTGPLAKADLDNLKAERKGIANTVKAVKEGRW